MSSEQETPSAGSLSRVRGGGGQKRNGNGAGQGRIVIPEEYARLHADIERASSPSRCFVVGVTSAVYGEGKTTVAMNLAGTMAQNSAQRVALVDANLRNWDLQARLNLPPCSGLVDVLEGGEDDLTNIIQKTELDNFTVIPAGRAAANPARLARSPLFGEVMSALRMQNDFIVMDMAPILPVADTRVLTSQVDGVVVVIRAGVTPREIVARAVEAVGNDRVIGVVLNGTETAMPRWLQRYFS
jgi:protein-tyrosine kinase